MVARQEASDLCCEMHRVNLRTVAGSRQIKHSASNNVRPRNIRRTLPRPAI